MWCDRPPVAALGPAAENRPEELLSLRGQWIHGELVFIFILLLPALHFLEIKR